MLPVDVARMFIAPAPHTTPREALEPQRHHMPANCSAEAREIAVSEGKRA